MKQLALRLLVHCDPVNAFNWHAKLAVTSQVFSLVAVVSEIVHVLRIAVANHTDRAHPHANKIAVSVGGVALEVAPLRLIIHRRYSYLGVEDIIAIASGAVAIDAAAVFIPSLALKDPSCQGYGLTVHVFFKKGAIRSVFHPEPILVIFIVTLFPAIHNRYG